MNKKLIAAAIIVLLVAPFAAAEKSVGLTLSQIEANRRGIVEAMVEPSPHQAVDFWQTYWEYRGHVSVLNSRTVAVIEEFGEAEGSLKTDQAAALVNEVLDIETSRADVKEEFVNRLKKVLLPKQLVRWYQTENKMDSVIRAEMAATIPFDSLGAEPQTELTETVIRDRREELVNALVQPTPEQEKRFWYRYREYRKAMDALDKRLVKLIEEYAGSYDSLADDQAVRLAKAAADIDADRATRLEGHARWQLAVLTPKQMVRFLQVELKMDAVINLALAAVIPIEE